MTIAHVAASQAANGLRNSPSGVGGSTKQQILLLMTASAVIIFVQNARSGNPQPGNQYAAIGIVGFILLFLAEFAEELAFSFALLFFISVLLNSPKGVPFLPGTDPNAGATAAPKAAKTSPVAAPTK